MSTSVIYQTRKKIITRLKLPLHMIWADRRDHLVGDMTPLSGIAVLKRVMSENYKYERPRLIYYIRRVRNCVV